MKKLFKLFLVAIIIFLAVWLASIAKCEYLTHKYYDDFKEAYVENSMIGYIESFKVLKCDGNYAEVYYIDKYTGNILSFTKHGNEWVYDSWYDTVWSVKGNADGTVWPYWWTSRRWLK